MRRTDDAQQLVLSESLIPFDGQVLDPRLLALLDLDPDKQFALVAHVIIDDLVLHVGLMESVGIVKSANGSHVILDQRRRIPSGRSIRSGLNSQPAGEKGRAEVLVAGKRHTDQAMPVMTGIQLIEVLRTRRPGLPVILATGYAELPKGISASIGRLSKPFTQRALAEALAATVIS